MPSTAMSVFQMSSPLLLRAFKFERGHAGKATDCGCKIQVVVMLPTAMRVFQKSSPLLLRAFEFERGQEGKVTSCGCKIQVVVMLPTAMSIIIPKFECTQHQIQARARGQGHKLWV